MMTPRVRKLLIEAMVKHLPPSAARLRLVDVDGATADIVTGLRGDVEIVAQMPQDLPTHSADAVMALDQALEDGFLAAALAALRPGGRLIIMHSAGDPTAERAATLEAAGYTRILVEVGVECPLPTGVLMRGEKPHTTADTLARVQVAAAQDEDAQSLAAYRGRYVFLLVFQTPNKPVWALAENERVQWQALALADGGLLAFSSLPKAVAFMQSAIVSGRLSGVNKVAKFSKATAQTWTQPVLLNPSAEALASATTLLVDIDPRTAELPDE